MKYLATILIILFMAITVIAQPNESKPLRLAVAGTTHGHVSWILNRKGKTDVQMVGVYEKNTTLVEGFAQRFGFSTNIIYNDLGKMLDAVKPEAVVAFGSIYEHLAVVEACAPRGIHVMVEKPLAVSVEHAEKMEALARKHNIYLLTNYETSWYPTTEKTYQLVTDSSYIGTLKKAVFHHGHSGPKEIGVGKEFLDWLTDPVQNGGGALIDFGCYGANIMTYLTRGVKPTEVMALTKQFKPSIYPKVDDEATIVVNYPGAQCIIQASWNWPFSRKDMEVYGDRGYIIAPNQKTLLLKNAPPAPETRRDFTPADVSVYQDPFSYFADVIRKKIQVPEYSLYSLSNNMMVVRILQAARESAKSGKAVKL